MQIIHAACAHDQHTFDGWVIGKAFYGRYDDPEPVSFETRTQRMRQGYARLSSKGYDKERNLVQDLVLVLVDPSCVNGVTRRDTYTDVFPGRPMHGLTFPSEGLKRFLRDSGDTNPIHHGKQAVVPGLWIVYRAFGNVRQRRPQTRTQTITVYPWDSISGSSIRCAQDRLYSWYVLRTQSQECAADLFIFIYR